MGILSRTGAVAGAGLISLWDLAAMAQEDVAGKPVDAGIGFQRPVTPVMHDLVWLDDMLLVIITAISLFVLGLLVYVIVRYRAGANPTPARFTHNPTIEVIWTAVPVLILVVIAVPSLRLLFLQLEIPESELTIKATGYQWYWGYEYPDHDIAFDAIMLQRDELEEYGYQPDEYLLATDTRIIVPVDTNVRLLVTAADVIHNFAMPSFGLKADAIPGRIHETWFRAEETGTFFGQCSELCGINHAYMPITVEVVSKDDFEAWVGEETAARTGGDALAAAD